MAETKVAIAPGVYVVQDAFGTVVRQAEARDVALLPFRSIVAPFRMQRAFEALHGAGEWLPEYDRMRPIE
jgi:hypothetical protein